MTNHNIEDCLDEDGYPTDYALTLIETWDWHSVDTLFEFMRGLWAYNNYWSQTDDGEKIIYDISTAGWSGNESLIDALRKNYVVWMMAWVQSRRGGHYIFELNYSKQPSLMHTKTQSNEEEPC